MKTKPQYRIVSVSYNNDNDDDEQLCEAAEALFNEANIRPTSVEDQFLVVIDPIGGGILGALAFGFTGPPAESRYLFSVVTHHSYRGRGIATALWEFLQRQAKSLAGDWGCKEPSFYAKAVNERSSDMLARWGFVSEHGRGQWALEVSGEEEEA